VTTIIEQRLRFDFGSTWEVEKFDEHTVYRDGIERLKEPIVCGHCRTSRDVGTKAVDFIGRHQDRLYLLEVKDFHGHGVENRKRLREQLAIEVALKVRDTLAALVGALHFCRPRSLTLRPLAEQVLRNPPKVLVWLEMDPFPARLEQRGDPTLDLRNALRQSLRWLNPDVWVVNHATVWPALDLTVSRIPDRVYEVRRIMTQGGSISREDFGRAWGSGAQTAGGDLLRLCDAGFLRRSSEAAERFVPGPGWDSFHEDTS